MKTIIGTNELRGYAYAIARTLHTALENMSNIECVRDCAHVLLLSFKSEARRARRYTQARDLDEHVQQSFCES
ncbi:MAG: hypothetical protein IIC09_04675, partial [Proteobacteria bacterium]|nr:hypothetical protein [Pseudomonadota bacterium]